MKKLLSVAFALFMSVVLLPGVSVSAATAPTITLKYGHYDEKTVLEDGAQMIYEYAFENSWSPISYEISFPETNDWKNKIEYYYNDELYHTEDSVALKISGSFNFNVDGNYKVYYGKYKIVATNFTGEKTEISFEIVHQPRTIKLVRYTDNIPSDSAEPEDLNLFCGEKTDLHITSPFNELTFLEIYKDTDFFNGREVVIRKEYNNECDVTISGLEELPSGNYHIDFDRMSGYPLTVFSNEGRIDSILVGGMEATGRRVKGSADSLITINSKDFINKELAVFVIGYMFDTRTEGKPLIVKLDEQGHVEFVLKDLLDMTGRDNFRQRYAIWITVGTVNDGDYGVILDGSTSIDWIRDGVEQSFVDVPEYHWAYDDVQRLVQLKIIDGYDSGMFMPDDFVTRAEYAKMLVQAFEVVSREDTYKKFEDYNDSDWFAPYQRKIADYMLDSEGKFNGNVEAQRWDIMVTLINLKNPGYTLNPASSAGWDLSLNYASEIRSVFSDVPDGWWIDQYIWLAHKHEVINGYPDGTFRSGELITRAEAAAMIRRVLGL